MVRPRTRHPDSRPSCTCARDRTGRRLFRGEGREGRKSGGEEEEEGGDVEDAGGGGVGGGREDGTGQ